VEQDCDELKTRDQENPIKFLRYFHVNSHQKSKNTKQVSLLIDELKTQKNSWLKTNSIFYFKQGDFRGMENESCLLFVGNFPVPFLLRNCG